MIVHPLDKPCRMQVNVPKIMVHKSTVLDMEFHPFIPTLIASGSDDTQIKITQIPDGGLTENISAAVASLEGHEKKVNFVHFHPTANGVLGSAASDNTLRIWDIEKQAQALSFNEFGDYVQSFDWNADGSFIATTSRDLHLRIFDPRDAKSVIKTEGFSGSKGSRVLWLDNHSKLAVVGFGKTSERLYGLWDPKKMDKPITKVEMDKQAGVMIPYYDPDTSMLYVGSKGGSNIGYYEITDQEPYVHFLSEFRDNQSQKGLSFLPKRYVDVGACEVAVALRLMKDAVIPISFKVPRKSDLFQKDLFPDAYAGVPSIDAKDWFAGENKPAKKISLNPKDKVGGTTTAVKMEFKAAKSAGELQKELDAANARIKELEAEVARMKTS
jgi:coronin-1B/1C/6